MGTLRDSLYFGPFRLEIENARLWRGTRAFKLSPKAFALLRYLVERPEHLVTKAELLDMVWPDVMVEEAALTVCMSDLRKALGDTKRRPRFIETVHGRGYRWIASLSPALPVQSPKLVLSAVEGSKVQSQKAESPKSALRIPPAPSVGEQSAPTLVGREAELAQLHGWLDKARQGERQIVFVTGQPGIGKTAVVDAFLAQIGEENQKPALSPSTSLRINSPEGAKGKRQKFTPSPFHPFSPSSPLVGHGQCIEHFGPNEAYLPVLTALSQMGREAQGQRVVEALRQYAPTWLAQMPGLQPATPPQPSLLPALSRDRMLRELAEALEALSTAQPLVLVLEDLHWSDAATVDLLNFLARRRQPARLLVIGTYRPVELVLRDHPLKAVKQELQIHEQCVELMLGPLAEGAVTDYVDTRFSGAARQAAAFRTLAQRVYRRTEGNPLFMVNVLKDLVSQGVVAAGDRGWVLHENIESVEIGIPRSLRQMIERQVEHLNPDDSRVLEAASVAGAEFSVAAVAAGADATSAVSEAFCAHLARREQFLQHRGTETWPDGTRAARYGFAHELYREVVYQRLGVGQQAELHRRIGERVEAAYGARASEIATVLAVHFERGGDVARAVQYHEHAAQTALRRSGNREAITHLTAALELLKTSPDTPERARHELTLHVALGPALIAIKGWSAPEVERTYARARELCQQVGDIPQLFPVLVGLREFYLVRADLQTARELAEHCLALAQDIQDPAPLPEAHAALGQTLFWLGEFTSARTHLEQGLALYRLQPRRSPVFLYGYDAGVSCLAFLSYTLWHLGYPEQALQRSHEALTLAQEVAHPFSLAFALGNAAVIAQYRREWHVAQERAEALITLCTEHGFPIWLMLGTVLRGWALAEQGQAEAGIAQIRQGLAAAQAAGAELARLYYLALLAEAYGRMGRAEEGLSVLAEALTAVNKTGERWHEAELYRLKGELTLQQSRVQSLQ